VDLSGAHLLIADDVADTGETVNLVADTVRPRVHELRTAVLYEKSRSIVQCDYVWRRTDDWIVFPWSAQPPITNS
jgi:hypoxanthine phosphoribosyltransferase